MTSSKDKKSTTNKFIKARILGEREFQISVGACSAVAPSENMTPESRVKKEIKEEKIPLKYLKPEYNE